MFEMHLSCLDFVFEHCAPILKEVGGEGRRGGGGGGGGGERLEGIACCLCCQRNNVSALMARCLLDSSWILRL